MSLEDASGWRAGIDEGKNVVKLDDRGVGTVESGGTKASSVSAAVLNRIRAEYVEMPGMSLSVAQVAWLCGVDRSVGALVLDALVCEEFLFRKSDGTYVRRTDESSHHGRRAKADLDTPARFQTHHHAS